MKSSPGFTIFESVAGLSIMVMSTFAMISLSTLNLKSGNQEKLVRMTIATRSQLEAAISNPGAWQRTLNNNNNMECIHSAPGCQLASDNDGFYNFVIFNSDGEKLSFDIDDPLAARFNIHGGLCPEGSANDNCRALRYKAFWKPLCEIYPCLNPQIQIKMDLELSDNLKDQAVLNPNKYALEVSRTSENQDVKGVCESMNGIYDVASGSCFPKYAGKNCFQEVSNHFQVVQNVSDDGSISCGPVYRGTCDSATEYVSGFNSNGQVQCSPKVCP